MVLKEGVSQQLKDDVLLWAKKKWDDKSWINPNAKLFTTEKENELYKEAASFARLSEEMSTHNADFGHAFSDRKGNITTATAIDGLERVIKTWKTDKQLHQLVSDNAEEGNLAAKKILALIKKT
jgi:hypothetical protein